MKFFSNKNLIFILILWLMFWAGYNTSPQKLDFSHPLKFVHAIRAFFPILAGFLAVIFLIKKKNLSFKIFRSPLGLLLVYALIGIISSIFLSREPSIALYWAFSYGAVLLVLLAILFAQNATLHLSSLINLNWIIVFIITIFLFGFFLLQPGVISSLASNFLVGRPYEDLAGVRAEKEILGMVGTRPTGLGRYVGVLAILVLAKTILNEDRKKFLWYFLFLISFLCSAELFIPIR